MASTPTPDEWEHIKAAAWSYADQTHILIPQSQLGKMQFQTATLTGTTNPKLQVVAGET
jgi:hypothetical protein